MTPSQSEGLDGCEQLQGLSGLKFKSLGALFPAACGDVKLCQLALNGWIVGHGR
jgi:hypothetical protein